MKRKFIKVLSFLFVFLFLLTAIPIGASARATDAAENIATSDVMTDLERFGIDITSYQKDLDAKHCRMLNFFEYGYCYYSVASDYGLYVYMWNPTGKPIELNGKNRIQMALLNSYGEETKGFSKYPLEYISHSTQGGYEHLFYKFRVGGISGIQGYLEKAMRRYDISGVELHFQGDNNATESGVSATYSFTGYMSYRGADTSVRNTLKQYVSDRTTLGLELHGTTWKTSTSDKGQDYAYEIFSVYFSVPNDIIEDYGDKNDATKGLVEVDGEFEEYKVNGIVTDNANVYNFVYDYLGSLESSDIGITSRNINDGLNSTYGHQYGYNPFPTAWIGNKISRLCGVYRSYEYKNDILLSNNDFLEEFYALKKELGGIHNIGADDGRRKGKQSYTIKDTDDWSTSIANYASSHKNKLWEWLCGRNNLILESKNYGSIKALEVVTLDKVLSTYNDEYISESLFIDKNDVSVFRNFVYEETAKNNTVYLMRFAVCDYFCSPVRVLDYTDCTIFSAQPEEITLDTESYFFVKTVFLDFDIMYFTWENEYEKKTVIPVVASPIDIVGSITPPTEPSVLGNIADKVGDFFKSTGELAQNLAKFKAIVLLIGGLLILAVVVWIFNKLGVLSFIGKAFSGIEKRIDKHRERRKRDKEKREAEKAKEKGNKK